MKRGFDLVVSLILLLLLSPLIAVLALAVAATSSGSPLHRARRVGRGGAEFTLFKLRTMREGTGPGVTSSADPRITRVGRLLRRTHLDELPQLWNVVRGDMSLVGPRPEDPRFVATYTAIERAVLAVRPGLTGPAQLAHRDEEQRLPAHDPEGAYVRDVLPGKLAIDLAYVRGRSFAGDLAILARTIASALGR